MLKRNCIGLIVSALLFCGTLDIEAQTLNQSQTRLRNEINTFLKEDGFMPEIQNDGDIRFKKEGSTYFITIDEDDVQPMYVTLAMAFNHPQGYSINQMKIAAANLNLYKGVKACIYDEYFTIQAEMFLMQSDQFKYSFYTLMSQIASAAGEFGDECEKAPKSYGSSSYSSSSNSNKSSSSGSSYSSSSSSSSPMTISRTSLSLSVGQTATLSCSNYGSSLSWESDNEKVATVSSNGVVRGVGAGTTSIWAKGKEYKRCSVTVSGSSSSSYSSSSSSSNTRTLYSKEATVKVGQHIKAQLSEGKVTRWEVSDYQKSYIRASGDELIMLSAGEVSVWGYIDNSPKLFKLKITR